MKQLTSSWQTFSVLFIAVALLCLFANYFCRRIGRQRKSAKEEVILPLQYSSETTTSVLRKCPSLIPPTTTEGDNGEQRQEEDALLPKNRDCFQDLPSELVIRIISFLPLASIGLLVRVCKAWSDVLRDPQNMDLLLGRKHLGRPNHNPIFLVEVIDHQRSGANFYLLDSMRTSTYHFSKLPVQKKEMLIPASCSGFICCSYHGTITRLALCNPLTQEFLKLPELPEIGSSYLVFGLGIDLTRNKPSKLVRVLCSLHGTFVFECNVYTFGINCWRSVEVPNFTPRHHGILYKWTLYWIVCKDPSSSSSVAPILTFDLENETFSAVSPPNTREGHEPRCSYLTNFGYELCCVNVCERDTEIHVLEDDATMVWSFRYLITDFTMSFSFRGVWANDGLLVQGCQDVYYYDSKDAKFRKIYVPGVWRCRSHSKFVIGQIFPNLISPKLFFS